MDIDFLKAIGLLSQASDQSLKALSHCAKWCCFKKRAIFLDSANALDTFFYVVNGWVKLSRNSAAGEEIIVDVLSQSQYSGEQFIFNPHKESGYSAQAITDIEIIIFPTLQLKKILSVDHSFSLSFLQVTLEKQKNLSIEVEHLSIQNAAQRIGCFLLRLCPLADEKNIILHLPYDKVLLASRLGMRPETFSRALNKLSERCHVRVEGDEVHIDSIGGLVKEVCTHCSRVFPCQNAACYKS